MSADLGDVHLFSGGKGGGGDDGEDGGGKKPTYTGPLHSNVKQLLEALRRDPRFSNVDPRILNEIIDAAIKTADAIGSQSVINALRRAGGFTGSVITGAALGALGMAIPPLMFGVAPAAISALVNLLTSAMDSDDRTKAKSQLYEEVVKRLTDLNRMTNMEQYRVFAGLSRRSAMRDVLPPVEAPRPPVAPGSGQPQSSMAGLLFNLPRPGAGYARPGASDEDGAAAAGAGGGADPGYTYADMAGRPPMPDSMRDRVEEMLRQGKKFKKKFPPMQSGAAGGGLGAEDFEDESEDNDEKGGGRSFK